MELITSKLAKLLCVTVLLMLWAIVAIQRFPYDLDLYYYGGFLQRHGVSYTDATRVVGLAHAHHRAVAVEGVYGAPSLMALVFEPVSFLSRNAAHVIWFFSAFSLVVYAVRRAAGQYWHIWLLIFGLSPAAIEATWLGNWAIVTCCLLLLSYAELRRGDDKRAGIYLGLAAAFKVYPGVLLLVFLVTRRWTAAKWFVGTLAALTAATFAVLGSSQFEMAFRALRKVGGGVPLSPENSSVPSLVRRHFENGAAMSVTLILLLVVAALIWRLRKIEPAALFAVACAALMLAEGVSWRMYFSATLLLTLELCRQRNTSIVPWIPAVVLYEVAAGHLVWFLGDNSLSNPMPFTQVCATLIMLAMFIRTQRSVLESPSVR